MKQGHDRGRTPAQRSPEGDGRKQGHDRREEDGESRPVEGNPGQQVAAPGHQQDRRHGTEYAEGDVDEEDQTPTSCGQEQAPDCGTHSQAEGLGCALQADRLSEGLLLDHEHDDGQAVRLQHRRADGLEGPEDA